MASVKAVVTPASLLAGAAIVSLLIPVGCSSTPVAQRPGTEPLPPVDKAAAAKPTRTPPPAPSGDESFFDPFSIESIARAETRPPTPARPMPAPEPVAHAEAEHPETDPHAEPHPGRSTPVVASTGAGIHDGMESISQVTFALEGAVFDPFMARDGKTLLFSSTQHRPTADIYMARVGSRTVTQLTSDPGHDVMPAMSPDGGRIAFASNRSGWWNIYIMSSAGGQPVQLTSERTHSLHPSWSPDGSRLVFCRLGEVSGRWELWVTDVTHAVPPEFIGYGLFPEWCPVPGTGSGNRDRIVFQRSRERGDRAFSVWTVDYKPGDVSAPTEIANSSAGAVINPSWSPDGKWISYATVPAADGNGTSRPKAADLWMTDASGNGRVNLTAGRFVNLMPTWGTDGRIFFISDRGGVDNIWSVGTERAMAAMTGGRGSGGSQTASATDNHGGH